MLDRATGVLDGPAGCGLLAPRGSETEAVVISTCWPNESSGLGIAVRSSLSLFAQAFSQVHFVAPTPVDGAGWQSMPRVAFVAAPMARRPKWVQFVRSIVTPYPAAALRVAGAADDIAACVSPAVQRALRSGKGVVFIYEDVPSAAVLDRLKSDWPDTCHVIRSHNVLHQAFAGLDRSGSFQSIPWKIEIARLRSFERRVCTASDAVWSIASTDAAAYESSLGVRVAGTMGVWLDLERYSALHPAVAPAVVNIGTADLRKGRGIQDFIRDVWPLVRRRVPHGSLVLAGRGTERYSDTAAGIAGLGYVQDDAAVLKVASIFVNPQRVGSGVKVKSVIAMAAGRALVSTSNGAAALPGVPGEDYYVADDPKEMAARISELLTDPRRAAGMGRRAREQASAEYSFSRFAKRGGPLLNDVIGTALRRKGRSS